jgi:LAO/AO transport system kinase
MVRAFDLAEFDVVLLETVGVGQTELEIMNVADHVAVTLVPESGDSIQGMKAGLLEIANTFIVNKGDRPGADGFIRELEGALHLDSRTETKHAMIFKTTAITGDGLKELYEYFLGLSKDPVWRPRRLSSERLQAEARALLREAAEIEIRSRTSGLQSPEEFALLFRSESKKP